MRVKYFIRGLGFGILITAIILGASYKSKNSDEDIILRAKKLGMVFAEDVSGSAIELDKRQTSEPVVTDDVPAASDTTDDPDADNTDGPDKEPADVYEANETPKPSDKLAQSDKPGDGSGKGADSKPVSDKKIKFSIKSGDLASSVSKQLEKLGLIKDAREFNRYLSDNGYSVRIKVGDFTAEKGMSHEEIAKMISR